MWVVAIHELPPTPEPPFTIHLLPNHHPPFTIHHSPFTIHSLPQISHVMVRE
ncbi:MAG: hypothetical protein LH613_02270 [Chamaesiphon sp.]|nr:hypothetical protein [Chamaesiphon sp.]